MNFSVKKNIFKETGADEVAFHILDFNRPQETRKCLESIRLHAKFNYKVLLYSNGGSQDYIWQLYNEDLINFCTLGFKNEGSSIGTIKLAESSPCKSFINLQCDNYLIRDIHLYEIEEMKAIVQNSNHPIIDLALVGSQVFSERAFMANLHFYLSNPYFTFAGTGPTQSNDLLNSEQATTKWLKENNKHIIHWPNRLIADNGKFAIIETPCGGILRRRCDTQELEVQRLPKEKMPAFNLSDEEWDIILAGNWEPWRIPAKSREWVFHYYSNEFENPANEIYRRK